MNIADTQQQAMLAAIIDTSEDAIISKDLNGYVTSWNKAAERVFGYDANEMIGKHISLLIPPERLHEEDMIISSLRRGERIEHYQTIRRTKDGNELHISLSVSPIIDPTGVVIGASKIARDITRQVEAQRQILEISERLQLVNSIGKTILSQLDVQSILQEVTDVTTKLSGAEFGAFFYNKTDVEGESYRLYALSGAPREAFEKFGMPRNTEVFKKTFNGEGVLRSDDITKDHRYGKNIPHKGMPEGHLPVVSYLAIPVMTQSGQVIGGLFFGHSSPGRFKHEHEALIEGIAAQASIALENARLYEEVKRLNDKKDEFIGFTSHELKTPLTTATGYLQLAEINPNMAPVYLPKIARQIKRLSNMVANLLDISKIQAGKLEYSFKKVSIREIIKECVESMKVVAPDRTFIITIPENPLEAEADDEKLSQVLFNLLNNAVKYSPSNTRILLNAEKFGDLVTVKITDEGIGIASEHVDKIFDRFYRIRSSKTPTEGFGVGLYITSEIINGHHGKIRVESKEGMGSSFIFSIPTTQPQGKTN